MAYSRYRRRRIRRRRNPIRRRRVTRTRRVRTRRPRRAMMSRRRILNITTTKKQDAMAPWSSNASNVTPSTNGPILFDRTTAFNDSRTMIFIPTARDRSIGNTNPDPNSESRRTATATFARGYAERITISTNSGLPWRWRRVVFMFKGSQFYQDGADQFYYERTLQGMTRLQIPTKTANQDIIDLICFQGSLGYDWANRVDAPLDRSRITVISDVVRTLNPGNQTGLTRTYNCFYPINKTLIYNDDEFGGDTSEAYFSSYTNQSCGDMYVMDYFSSMALPEPLQTGTSQIAVQCEGRYYWHER